MLAWTLRHWEFLQWTAEQGFGLGQLPPEAADSIV